MKLSTWVSLMLAYESALNHFEMKSVKTKRNCLCLELCRGSSTSIDLCTDGYGDDMDDRTSAGWRIVGTCLWPFLRFCANFPQSLTNSRHSGEATLCPMGVGAPLIILCFGFC